jgi:uncharacterized cupin superfamily protein
MGIAHVDEVPAVERAGGHLRARWKYLGEAAGSVTVGVRRIEVPAGAWSTPVHDHGNAEELFFVLGGRGLSWHDGATAEIRTGDAIVCRAGGGAHTMHATETLDVLAFGPRLRDESVRMPRTGLSMLGGRFAETLVGDPGGPPLHFTRELELGPPPLPAAPGERPPNIVNLADVTPERVAHTRVARTRRDLARAGGSISTGLLHVEVEAGMAATPLHCHALEEEIFVILDGDGVLMLDDAPTPVRTGHVIARPAGTGVAHAFVAGERGLTLLAYGTRENGDICFYPRSGKVLFAGIGLMGRIESLDYWDGED